MTLITPAFQSDDPLELARDLLRKGSPPAGVMQIPQLYLARSRVHAELEDLLNDLIERGEHFEGCEPVIRCEASATVEGLAHARARKAGFLTSGPRIKTPYWNCCVTDAARRDVDGAGMRIVDRRRGQVTDEELGELLADPSVLAVSTPHARRRDTGNGDDDASEAYPSTWDVLVKPSSMRLLLSVERVVATPGIKRVSRASFGPRSFLARADDVVRAAERLADILRRFSVAVGVAVGAILVILHLAGLA